MELLLNNFIIVICGNLSVEIRTSLKKSEWEKFSDKFEEVEFTKEEENFMPKIIKWKYGKDAAKKFETGRFKKYEGEIDAICISKFRNIPFVTMDKVAQLAAKNFEIEFYDIIKFINDFIASFSKNLQNKFTQKLQES